jgi:hypothetical protein
MGTSETAHRQEPARKRRFVERSVQRLRARRAGALETTVACLVMLCVHCSSDRADRKEATAKIESASSTAVDYRSLILNDGAVGYWRLGDKQANQDRTVRDEAPAHINGTYAGTYADTPPPVPNEPGAILGDLDSSALFYASNSTTDSPPTQTSYAVIPSNPNQAPARAELTLEAWFTMTPGAIPQTYSPIISKSTANWQDGYGLFWYSGTLYFFTNNLNIRVGVTAATIGDASQFHHVVGVYDGSALNIYLDGVLAATRALAANEGRGLPVNAGSGAFQIGKGFVSIGWQGRLDEVAFYDHALSATQVQSHFQAARPPGPLTREFVAYAERSLTLGTGDHVTGGDLGVASPAAASGGPQLAVGASTVVESQRTLFSPSVSLGAQAQVGTVDTNVLTNGGGSLVSQQAYPASAMPRSPLAPLVTPGTTNVTVLQGKTQVLYPGNYGALTDSGYVRLTPGAYSFSSITLGDSGSLLALPWGNTTVQVATTLHSGASASIEQANSLAGAFVITVAGTDPSTSTPVVSLGTSNQVSPFSARRVERSRSATTPASAAPFRPSRSPPETG